MLLLLPSAGYLGTIWFKQVEMELVGLDPAPLWFVKRGTGAGPVPGHPGAPSKPAGPRQRVQRDRGATPPPGSGDRSHCQRKGRWERSNRLPPPTQARARNPGTICRSHRWTQNTESLWAALTWLLEARCLSWLGRWPLADQEGDHTVRRQLPVAMVLYFWVPWPVLALKIFHPSPLPWTHRPSVSAESLWEEKASTEL